jgi:hypothetical protein
MRVDDAVAVGTGKGVVVGRGSGVSVGGSGVNVEVRRTNVVVGTGVLVELANEMGRTAR